MSAIHDEIEKNQRLAREQQFLETGNRLAEEEARQEEAVFTRAREAQEAEQGVLPEKYQGKSAAEVYALMQKEIAYKAEQAKKGEAAEDDQEAAPEAAPEESPAEEASEAETALKEASEEFYKNEGKLDEATVAKLEALPSADLIRAWQKLQSQTEVQAPISDAEAQEIVTSVGGQEAYNQALAWAAENLSPEDRASYDQVITSGNKAATRFAVEALTNRYKAAVGFDGEPVSGGRAKAPGVKPYRSEAELRRDLSNPRYQQDPAFRLDVEDRLAASGELL
jgi:hypothetical protein